MVIVFSSVYISSAFGMAGVFAAQASCAVLIVALVTRKLECRYLLEKRWRLGK